MLDILCVGDAILDIFLQIPEDNPHFDLNSDKTKLLIDYGYKIHVDDYVKEIGGNACNTAVGISRLGKRVGLCAEIGSDEFSNFILNRLKQENINTAFVSQSPNKKTSFSVSLSFKGDRTLLVEHVERDHNFEIENSSARFVYLTSLGEIWQDAYRITLEFVKKTQSRLAFNPGTLQLDEKGKLVLEIIEACDFLFLNKQEAQKLLFGKDKDLSNQNSDIKRLLFGLRSLGAKNIIITDSSNGSFVFDETDNYYHLGIVEVKVVEKTGAGDAYNAGFIAAILNGKSITDAMMWATINSGSVIQKIGAQQGLLTLDELYEKLSMLGKLKVETI
ncbi:MAG: carbohydrate kinase family protein [Candidatus Levybacteria bacterium]|nr:carbohydrate kinase family protein [Candidatus Levybacteria bacterium]